MGGRGASSGVSVKGKRYGTEYKTVLQQGKVKFVKYNDAKNAKTPMETKTKGRIYVTLSDNDEIRSITLYSKKEKRIAQIDVSGRLHKVNGKYIIPHTHLGYFHDEYGTRKLNDYEKRLVARINKMWQNRGG